MRRFICLFVAIFVFLALSFDSNSVFAAPAKSKTKVSSKKTTAAKNKQKKSTRTKIKAKALPKRSVKSPAASYIPKDLKPGEFYVDVRGAVLMNMNNGKILYAQNPDMLIPPASLTKVLTLYVIFETIQQGRLKPWVNIPVSAQASTVGGSSMYLQAGDKVPLVEIIKGISVASANDGCLAVAEYLTHGSPDLFVNRMNLVSRRLGMRNSLFKNTNGLPAVGQQTTPRDMLTLARAYLQRYPQSLAIHSLEYFSYNGRTRKNSNSLLGKVEGVDGIKTGFVNASGYNLIFTAQRNGVRLLGVVMGANSSKIREIETTKLLEEGFRRAGLRTAKETGQERPAVSAAAGF